PDARWVATSTPNHEVLVRQLRGPAPPLTLPAESSDVWCSDWAPDGRRLAVGLSDGGVAVWDLEQVRARLAEFGIDPPSTAAPSPWGSGWRRTSPTTPTAAARWGGPWPSWPCWCASGGTPPRPSGCCAGRRATRRRPASPSPGGRPSATWATATTATWRTPC